MDPRTFEAFRAGAQSLSDTMRAPSNPPDIVVLDRIYDDENQQLKPLSTQQDLWVSTADGRFSSPPIPIRVGTESNMQIFYVHKEVLQRAVWFRKALSSNFREAEMQQIDLPEEDPALFHFLVAFLYEKRFEPIAPVASVLESKVNKGKGKDSFNLPSEAPARLTHAPPIPPGNGPPYHAYQRWVGMHPQPPHRPIYPAANRAPNPEPRGKRPGAHRVNCRCPRCRDQEESRRCWQCGASQADEPYQRQPQFHAPGQYRPTNYNVPQNPVQSENVQNIDVEDMSTWLMTYELNLDVYICANRYLMDDFRAAIMRSTIDMLEAAGVDAAHPTVLHLCGKLHAHVPGTDPLLTMVLARMGFLQSLLWKRYPEETSEIMRANPDMVTEMLKETVSRHRILSIGSGSDLPPMETVNSDNTGHQPSDIAPYVTWDNQR